MAGTARGQVLGLRQLLLEGGDLAALPGPDGATRRATLMARRVVLTQVWVLAVLAVVDAVD